VHGGTIYEAGDDVLVARNRTPLNMELTTSGISEVGYILSAAPPDFMATAQGYPGANIHGASLDYFNQTVTDAFASTKKLIDTIKDIGYGLPNDVFGGDYINFGPLHTFLTVCASKTAMGASPMAMVETFSFFDKVRITGRSLEDRGTAVESGREPDEGEMLYYERLARTEREGMGAVGAAAPFVEEDGEIQQAEEEQLGVFRHVRLRGPSGDGDIDALVAPAEEDAVHTKDGDTFGKVSVRQTYDGRHETRAAGGIDHIKSLFIPVPEQTKAHDKDTPNTFDPEPPYDEALTTADDFSPHSATLEADEFDSDTENYRNSRVKARPDYWNLINRAKVATEYPGLDVENAPRSMDSLAADQPFYAEPPSVSEVDPVTELARRLYALESIVRQQPDGTVVISDGHGSEILMHRGRITISPAADLELRPGRDCFELVPRRKVINAGEEVQIVSNEGKVRIKAETDLDVLAGNGGRGRMLLENRATAGVDEDPGGIVVRSKKDLRMTGYDLYLGLAPPAAETPGDANDSGLDRRRSGSLVIDARSGDIGLHGSKLYGRLEAGVSLSSGDSLLSIAGGIFTVIANTTQFATGPFTVGSIEEGSVEQVVLDEHGVTEETLTSRSSVSVLRLAGNIIADGAVFQGTVAAGSVSAAGAAFGNASLTSGLYAEGLEAPEISIDPFSVANIGAFAEAYGNKIPDDLTDQKILSAWFQFDQKKDVNQSEFMMHEMRWQAMMGVGGASSYWTQKAVVNDEGEESYAYPGYEDSDQVLESALLGKKRMDGYIVNK